MIVGITITTKQANISIVAQIPKIIIITIVYSIEFYSSYRNKFIELLNAYRLSAGPFLYR